MGLYLKRTDEIGQQWNLQRKEYSSSKSSKSRKLMILESSSSSPQRTDEIGEQWYFR
jgi:hypothetical protein